MIPIKPQPEPDVFNQKVRIPGTGFLKKVSGSKLTNKQWQHHDYWKEIRSDLYEAYNHMCAYNAHWIATGSSVPNVDHFIPKYVKPELAYEWSNYRLASDLANKLKGVWQDVLDPFCIGENWFFLDFPSLMVHPNPELLPEIQEQIWATINRLRLNEEQNIVEERSNWLRMYCKGGTNFSFWKNYAPFIAYELERQNLVEEIKNIMIYEL
jgi:hypothetical protein